MESFSDVISNSTPVLVDFYATWCQPCKMMHPVLEDLKAQYKDRLRVIKIDVDKHQDIAGLYRIQSVPTLMIFRNGQQLWRQSGAMSLGDLNSIVSKNIN